MDHRGVPGRPVIPVVLPAHQALQAPRATSVARDLLDLPDRPEIRVHPVLHHEMIPFPMSTYTIVITVPNGTETITLKAASCKQVANAYLFFADADQKHLIATYLMLSVISITSTPASPV